MDFENTDNFSFFPYLDFEKRGKKEVCPVLDQFLCHVAKTGETMWVENMYSLLCSQVSFRIA